METDACLRRLDVEQLGPDVDLLARLLDHYCTVLRLAADVRSTIRFHLLLLGQL